MSPCRRSKQNEKLPPYVYLKKGRYVLEVYDSDTQRRKESRLCSSTRLRAAVTAAKSLHGQILSQYLIPGPDRARLRESTVQTAWQRLKRRTGIDWTLHDLKAKGITDTKENKLAASGHKDQRMLAVYDRLPGRVKPTK